MSWVKRLNAIAAEHLGVGNIRGSGAHGREFQRKGGVEGFREVLEALAQRCNVALTAVVPKISRVAGLGIVKLASASARPIYVPADDAALEGARRAIEAGLNVVTARAYEIADGPRQDAGRA